MANPDVTIDLKANDSKARRILARFGKFTQGLGRTLAGAFRLGRQGLASIATAATKAAKALAVVGAATVALGGFFLKLFAEQEDAEIRLAAVIKATGGAAGFTSDQLKEMASDLQKITRVGDEVILNAQAILLTFKNIKGDQFRDATKAALDMSAVLQKEDLNSAILQLGKALNDPIKGVTALTRAGVSLSEQQIEMIQSFVESNDIISAQKIVLDELKGEFGEVAAALARSTGGMVAQLRNRLGDIGEQLGKALVPGLERVIGAVDRAADTIEENLDDITADITAMVKGTIDAFVQISPHVELLARDLAGLFSEVNADAKEFGENLGILDKFLGQIGDVVHTVGLGFKALQRDMDATVLATVRAALAVAELSQATSDFIPAAAAVEGIQRILGLPTIDDTVAFLKEFEDEITKTADKSKKAFDEAFLGKTFSERVDALRKKLQADADKAKADAEDFIPEPTGPPEFLEQSTGLKDAGLAVAKALGLSLLESGTSVAEGFKAAGIAAADAAEETISKIKPPETPGFTAAFEGLQSLARRIDLAGASVSPEERTAKAAEKGAAEGKRTADGVGKLVELVTKGAGEVVAVFGT